MTVQRPGTDCQGSGSARRRLFFSGPALPPWCRRRDEEAPTLLDKITISSYATRSPQPTFDVPGAYLPGRGRVPQATPLAGDVADLLEFTPGVEVDNGPRRNGPDDLHPGF